jgi:hypothetical protein
MVMPTLARDFEGKPRARFRSLRGDKATALNR